ncbi:hypothetical protein GCM10010924_59120 [Rhizobium wenxiniae]|nr:hypothetical protein GCM10010924_59120 [Rhizobium wenxiniae]
MKGEGHFAIDRSNVEKGTVTLNAELPQSRVRSVDQTFQVDVDQAGVILDGDIPEKTDSSDTDIVDPNINAAESVDGGLVNICNLVSVADVGLDRDRRSSGRYDLPNDVIENVLASGSEGLWQRRCG